MTIFLGLGSNLGNCLNNLSEAIQALPPAVQVVNRSSLYWTTPQYYFNQPTFLNQVLEVKTSLLPLSFLAYLKNIEQKMGRIETVRYGPRLIDIDILYYNEEVLQTPVLTLPHPEISKREFVLLPLNEIAPQFMCPVTNKTISQLLKEYKKAE